MQQEVAVNELLQKAQSVAQVIVKQHLAFTIDQILELRPGFAQDYLQELKRFKTFHFNDPQALHQLAAAQTGGLLEWTYNRPLSAELWSELVGGTFSDLACPANLGAAATLIHMLLADYAESDITTAPYTLPEGWQRAAVPLDVNSVKFPLQPDELPEEAIRNYFSDLLLTQGSEIGGCELMVAMNMDAPVARDESEDFVTIYNPSAFHFELATGEGNIVTLMLENRVALEEVVMGCGAEYGYRFEEGSEPDGIKVGLTINNKSSREEVVRIPAGSIFEVVDPELEVQNVTVVRDYLITVAAGGRLPMIVRSRCLNRGRGGPHNHPGRLTPFRYVGSSTDQNVVWNSVSRPRK